MASEVRLCYHELFLATILCLWALTGALRYGSSSNTLHLHKSDENEYMGRSVQTFYGGEDAALLHHRVRRDAPHTDLSATPFKLNDSNYQMIIHWAGKNSDVIVALTRDILPDVNTSHTNLYISKNYGSSFTKKILKIDATTPAILDRFYNSPAFNSHYIFTDVFHKVVFTTRNYAKDIFRYDVPFAPRQIAPHPKKYAVLIGHDDEDPKKKLYISMDFGATWRVIQTNVKSFYWGVEGLDSEDTLFVEREERDGSTRLLRSTNYFTGDMLEVFGRALDVQIVKKYIFATRMINNRNDSLELWVSVNRLPFKKAEFSLNSTIRDFFIADASEDAVLVCVTYNVNKTDLYVSDFTGTQYSLSLRNVVYYNPELDDGISWLRAFEEPFADVHRVEGLKGIYIASVQEQVSNTDNSTGLKSYITHNLGGIWFPVAPPRTDSQGKRYNCSQHNYFWPHWHRSCSLHLAQKYHALFPLTRAVPILSKRSAIGLIMATGVVNQSMSTDLNVYISRDGGFVWHEAMQEPHFYAFGDHGGIIVAVRQKSFTREVMYSTDEGETWNAHPFHTEELRVYGILTEPGERTMIFSIFGSQKTKHSWIIIKLDMTHIFSVNCTRDDYKDWSPSSTGFNDCLLGRKTVYQRRISHAQCFNGQEFEREVSVVNCPCKIEDYECDYGFEKRFEWSLVCVADKEHSADVHAVPSSCPVGNYYNRSKGYRKISGDTCGGGDAYRFDPDQILCPVQETNEFLLYANSTAINQVNLADNHVNNLLPFEALRNVKSIEYDYQENCLYWVSGWRNTIRRNCFNGSSGTENVIEENTEIIESIALDWNTNNIFWLEVGTVKKIEVATTVHLDQELEEKIPIHRRMIIGKNTTDLINPKSLVVYPKFGFMFWADQQASNPRIRRAWMDGQHVEDLVTKRMVRTMARPQGLTIDSQRDLLFWVDTGSYEIWYCTIGGRLQRVAPTRLVSNVHALTLSIFKDEVYFPDYTHNSIMAVHKYLQSSHAIRRTVRSSVGAITDLKVFSSATQHGDTPCSQSNGQCSSICVERPNNASHPMPLNRTCLCAEFYASIQRTAGSKEEKCHCGAAEISANNTCISKNGSTCDSGQMMCANKRCIPSSWMCDRDNDCGDLTDERDCSYFTCSPLQFMCANGRCIPKHWHCDHDNDCDDASDESENCQYSDCNNSTQFTCANNRCIPQRWRCDGDDDCHDGSDEENCNLTTIAPSVSCGPHDFRCANGRCISNSWVCDGDYDCSDNSDEASCNATATPAVCEKWQFLCSSGECIERSWFCDGQQDCRSKEDEANCSRTTVTPSTSCSGSFMCLNRMCISFSERCDGVDDCGDNSDEDGCQSSACPKGNIQCGSGECLRKTYQCNGNKDCADGSDEMNCGSTPPPTCSPEQFQCYMGGFVHCIYQSWVCDGDKDCETGEDEFNCTHTKACDETKNFKCAEGEGCIPKLWLCDGDSDCPDKSDEMCGVGNSTVSPTTCPERMYSCGYGICITFDKVCDGHNDCPDSQDEANCTGNGIRALYVKQVTNDSVWLQWGHAQVPDSKSPYKVKGMYRMEKQSAWTNTSFQDSSNKEIKITPLSADTDYIISATFLQNNKTFPPVAFKRIHTGEGAPDAPVLISAAPVKDGLTMDVKWKAPVHPNGVLRKFEVFFKDTLHSGNQGSKTVKVTARSPAYELKLYDLPFGHRYKFWVVAWTSLPSVPSNAISSLLGQDALLPCVETTVKFTGTSGVVNLITTQDEKALNNTEGYTLHIIATEAMRETKVELHKNNTKYNIDRVAEGVTYEIYAVAKSAIYVGPVCKVTKQRAPGTLSVITSDSIKITSYDQNYFRVSWNSSIEATKDKTFTVYYTSDPHPFEHTNFNLNAKVRSMEVNDTHVVLSGLQACEIYELRVQVTAPYFGALSQPKSFATDQDEQAPPENVRVRSWNKGGNGYLRVAWDPPCLEAQDGLPYVVKLDEVVHDTIVSTSGYDVKSVSPRRGINITISKLQRGATYKVSVMAKHPRARYSPAEIVQIAPLAGPRRLRILRYLMNANKPVYVLNWDAPKDDTDKLPYYEVHRARVTGKKPLRYQLVATMQDKTYTPSDSLKAGNYLFKVRVIGAGGGKYPSAFSEAVDYYKPSAKGNQAHHGGIHSSLTLVAIIVPCSIVVILLSAMLTVAIMRNRRLQRSFLSYANSHYDTRSGTTTFSTSDDLGEEEEPMIRGFSDDEPLVMA